jgi:hypothetical protein
MRRAVKFLLALLSCGVIALIVALILAGISESGVVAVQITHFLFWIAFITSIVAAPLAAWVFFKSTKHALAALLLAAIIIGGGLWWLDNKLGQMKAAQDAANRPPPPLPTKLVNTPGPRVAIVKTPKSWLASTSPTNQVSGNGNVVGNSIRGNNNGLVGSISLGSGSIAQVGGSGNVATINNRIGYAEMTDDQKSIMRQILSNASSGAYMSITTINPSELTSTYAWAWNDMCMGLKGWSCRQPDMLVGAIPPGKPGIHITTKTEELKNLFRSAVNKAHIDATVEHKADMAGEEDVVIGIGPPPMPPR